MRKECWEVEPTSRFSGSGAPKKGILSEILMSFPTTSVFKVGGKSCGGSKVKMVERVPSNWRVCSLGGKIVITSA